MPVIFIINPYLENRVKQYYCIPALRLSHPCLPKNLQRPISHYCDVIMGPVASKITSLTIVYSAVYSDADQRKHQSSASLAFMRGIHRGPVNSPHKWPVSRTMFPFDDVIMERFQVLHWSARVPCLNLDSSHSNISLLTGLFKSRTHPLNGL